MLLHHLFGAQFGGIGHGDLVIVPGGGYHPGHAVFFHTHRPGDHISHGVDQPDADVGFAVGGDLHSFLRHEFGLCGHNGLAGAALGQLIGCPLPAIGIGDRRDHQLFHDAFDQGGFTRANGPHNPNINIATGACGNISVNRFHSQPPSAGILPAMIC